MFEVRSGRWVEGLSADGIVEPRAAAAWIVEHCLSSSRGADEFEGVALAALDSRDRALGRRLSSTVLRWLRRLDDVIARAAGRPLERIDDRLLSPLRLGAAQLLFLDRVPPHAAVSTSVELARRVSKPAAGFVNAVLRNISRAGGLAAFPVDEEDPVERLALETSHPSFLVERWVSWFGEEAARRALEAGNRDRPASFLVLGGERRREEALRRLARGGVEGARSVLSPLGLLLETRDKRAGEEELEGLYPQDEASQCAALIPPPEAGERIYDAAAAPGGKSLAILAWQPEARVVAGDSRLERMRRLAANVERTEGGALVVATDALRPGLASGFDRVLADLPCTGTGTLRKHPELKWRISPAEIDRLARQARAMLGSLVTLVRPGGLLIVATCSLEREENEDQVAALLGAHPDLEPLPLEGRLIASMRDGVEAPGRWRILPGDDHDGFTVHALRRASR